MKTKGRCRLGPESVDDVDCLSPDLPGSGQPGLFPNYARRARMVSPPAQAARHAPELGVRPGLDNALCIHGHRCVAGVARLRMARRTLRTIHLLCTTRPQHG